MMGLLNPVRRKNADARVAAALPFSAMSHSVAIGPEQASGHPEGERFSRADGDLTRGSSVERRKRGQGPTPVDRKMSTAFSTMPLSSAKKKMGR